MEQTSPPEPLSIARVISAARVIFPKTPIVLGCMRPKGSTRGEIDVLALKAGVDAIAFPSEQAVDFVNTSGLKALFTSYCCAQIYVDISK